MAITSRDERTRTQGHVVFYGRNARWLRAVAKSLADAGHSHAATAEPEELRRLLLSQRFDLLALHVRDEGDAQQIADALKDVPLPPHKILAGSVSALPLIGQYHGEGTFRYTPGRLAHDDMRRLVETSLSSGSWQDSAEISASSNIEEVDLEEAIDNAAARAYAQAKRKRQRFHAIVEGPSTEALADPASLHRALVSLLALVVGLSSPGALVSVEARARNDDWTIRITAAAQAVSAGGIARVTEVLTTKRQVLRAAYRDISAQGGLLWVEVLDRATLGICLTLPLAPGVAHSRLPEDGRNWHQRRSPVKGGAAAGKSIERTAHRRARDM